MGSIELPEGWRMLKLMDMLDPSSSTTGDCMPKPTATRHWTQYYIMNMEASACNVTRTRCFVHRKRYGNCCLH